MRKIAGVAEPPTPDPPDEFPWRTHAARRTLPAVIRLAALSLAVVVVLALPAPEARADHGHALEQAGVAAAPAPAPSPQPRAPSMGVALPPLELPAVESLASPDLSPEPATPRRRQTTRRLLLDPDP